MNVIHLMSVPEEIVTFFFLRVLMFPLTVMLLDFTLTATKTKERIKKSGLDTYKNTN